MRKTFTLLFILSSFSLFAQKERLENEVKLDIPVTISDSVWYYVVNTYNNSELGYETSVATEHFSDQYYDTPDFSLLKNNDCIRYRKRTYEDGHKKKLIQIKTNANDDSTGLVRSEIKYKPRKKGGHADELTSLIKQKDLQNFTEHLKKVEDVNELLPAVYISQQRSRVYLSKDKASVATLTFDKVIAESHTGKSIDFIELELELNEKAYTVANDSLKVEMEKITEQIKVDLLKKFPEIKPDQTPKYIKAAKLLKLKPVQLSGTAKVFKIILPLIFLIILGFIVSLFFKNKK